MAPTRPSKRTSIRSRAAKSLDPRGNYAPLSHPISQEPSTADSTSTDDIPTTADSSAHTLKDAEWRLNKQDKRAIKHNTLLNKVRDSSISKNKKVLKRRRPGKKLAGGNLSDLADALPDAPAEDDEEEWEGMDDEEGDVAVTKKARRRRKKVQDGKMEMKSLSLRQGAMKRKAEMEGREKERFGRNLAEMSKGGGAEGQGQTGRWEALRAFIGGTMRENAAFKKG